LLHRLSCKSVRPSFNDLLRGALAFGIEIDATEDLDVTYTPDAFTPAALARRNATALDGVNPDGPPLITALEDQLGRRSNRAASRPGNRDRPPD